MRASLGEGSSIVEATQSLASRSVSLEWWKEAQIR